MNYDILTLWHFELWHFDICIIPIWIMLFDHLKLWLWQNSNFVFTQLNWCCIFVGFNWCCFFDESDETTAPSYCVRVRRTRTWWWTWVFFISSVSSWARATTTVDCRFRLNRRWARLGVSRSRLSTRCWTCRGSAVSFPTPRRCGVPLWICRVPWRPARRCTLRLNTSSRVRSERQKK